MPFKFLALGLPKRKLEELKSKSVSDEHHNCPSAAHLMTDEGKHCVMKEGTIPNPTFQVQKRKRSDASVKKLDTEAISTVNLVRTNELPF
jgi:hypothetical protein